MRPASGPLPQTFEPGTLRFSGSSWPQGAKTRLTSSQMKALTVCGGVQMLRRTDHRRDANHALRPPIYSSCSSIRGLPIFHGEIDFGAAGKNAHDMDFPPYASSIMSGNRSRIVASERNAHQSNMVDAPPINFVSFRDTSIRIGAAILRHSSLNLNSGPATLMAPSNR